MHIGAGKCGSSSLQAHLSANPHLTGHDGRAYEYACIKKNGRLLRGPAAKKAAARSPFGYSASVSVRELNQPHIALGLREAFQTMAEEGVTPILSFEGWINAGTRFADWNILECFGLEPRVIGFIRPQIPWLNSSWWQWGAWSNKGFEAWLSHWRLRGLWATALVTWQGLPQVRSVDFFTTSGDVVNRFHNWLEAPLAAKPVRANATLDGTMLRFLQRHPHLKRGGHAAAMDFVLAKHVKRGAAPPPWVLPLDRIRTLIAEYKKDNMRLLDLVDLETRSEIAADPAWWCADHFADKTAEPPDGVALSDADLEDIALRSFMAIPDMAELMRRRAENE